MTAERYDAEKHLAEQRRRAIASCRTLYPDGRALWECGNGWTAPIAKLSYSVECLNAFFLKEFRVCATADQVKEKFGGLRFYFSVRHCMRPLPTALCGLLDRVADGIDRHVDFKMKTVTLSPRKRRLKCQELAPDADTTGMPMGSVLESEATGTKYALSNSICYETTKKVPTRMRPARWLQILCRRLGGAISSAYTTFSGRQDMAAECLENLVDDLVGKAEKDCYSTCENCGREIGTKYSPRCETRGWIRYLCKPCAEKGGGKFSVHGAKEAGEDAP